MQFGMLRPKLFPSLSFLKPGLALRSFGDEVANRDSNLAKHPEDFALFHLGYYDDETGAVTSLPQPEQIALAINYVSA